MVNKIRFSIITPAKNEAENIRKTLNSVIAQSILPCEWIIIDDSSVDTTAAIVKEYAQNFSWIKLYTAPVIALDDYSSRVVTLFNFGLSKTIHEYDLIMKLDADVSFEKDFFENSIAEFRENPKLGIASGSLAIDGVPEKHRYENTNTRGATKFYRKTCLTDIGGLYLSTGWDTIDNSAARAKGWETRTMPFIFNHHKEEGSMAGSKLKVHYKTGLYNGSVPYILSFFLLKIFLEIFKKPFLLGAVVQFWGYIKARYIDKRKPFPLFVTQQLRTEQKAVLQNLMKAKQK